MSELDAQAFLSGEPEVVTAMRNKIIETLTPLEWVDAAMLGAVLSKVDDVQHHGDDRAYVREAGEVLKAAYEVVARPVFDAARARADVAKARADEIEAQWRKSQREFEKFRHAVTSKTIQ
jgi:hypothetical protein